MADQARPNRLDKISVSERRRQVAQLYLARRTQTEICRALGCAQSTVSADLAALREEWQREAITDLETALLRECAELDTIESQAAAQFAATKEVCWLQTRLKCKQQRGQLLGLAKHQVEVSGPGGAPLLFREVVVELPAEPAEPKVAPIAPIAATLPLPDPDVFPDDEPETPAAPYGALEVVVEVAP